MKGVYAIAAMIVLFSSLAIRTQLVSKTLGSSNRVSWPRDGQSSFRDAFTKFDASASVAGMMVCMFHVGAVVAVGSVHAYVLCIPLAAGVWVWSVAIR